MMDMKRCDEQLVNVCTHEAHLETVMVRGRTPQLTICKAANRNAKIGHLEATVQKSAADEEHAQLWLQGLYSEIVNTWIRIIVHFKKNPNYILLV